MKLVQSTMKLSTQTVHICKDKYHTLCGKRYDDNVINNNIKLGFTINKQRQVNKITCKKCLKIYNK